MIAALAATLLLAGGTPDAKLSWEHGFDDAIRKAKASHRPLMVDFWASWCGWCHRLDKTTYVDPQVVQLAAASFVAVKVNTEGSARETQIAGVYDVSSLPTIAFLTPTGRLILRLSGYQGPGQFPATLEQARDTATRVMAWESALEKNQKDAEALTHLAIHAFDLESYEEAQRLLALSLPLDAGLAPALRKKARLLQAMLARYNEDYAQAETLLKEALALQKAEELDPKLLYLLGKTYLAKGRMDDARGVLNGLLKDYPNSAMAQRARETLYAMDRGK